MTIQARRLLKKLKKAQFNQDEQIYIDFNEMTVCGVHAEGQPYTECSLKAYKDSIQSILYYLKGLGYIDYDDFGQAKVLHSGWKRGQIHFNRFLNFLLTSIVVPIFVSVVTSILVTLIALFLK